MKLFLPLLLLTFNIPLWSTTIACGESNTLAIDEYGNVWAFGENYQGELGLGDINTRLVPTKVDRLHPIKVPNGQRIKSAASTTIDL